MVKESPEKITPAKPNELLEGFQCAWINLFEEQPKKESLILLLSHVSLESGVGLKACRNYNLGNIKHNLTHIDGNLCDYTFYRCSELININIAKKLLNNSNGQAVITGTRNDGTCWVTFYPKHPWSCFKSFDSLNEGCTYYIKFLRYRYKPETGIWDAVIAGEPKNYSKLLRANGYYTCPEDVYTSSIVRLYNQFSNIKYDINNIPPISDSEKKRIMDLVQLTTMESFSNMRLHEQADDGDT